MSWTRTPAVTDAMLLRVPGKPSEAARIGTDLHTVLVTGEVFEDNGRRYAVLEPTDGRIEPGQQLVTVGGQSYLVKDVTKTTPRNRKERRASAAKRRHRK